MQRFVFVGVLMCVGQRALGQEFDCSTEAGQIAFLQNELRRIQTATIIEVVVNETQPRAADIEVVSEGLAIP